jgi:hypothetical protein
LAAVIGLGFGVFSIAKGVANEGTVGVQDNLGSVSESAFDDYNDKIVTGTMVKSAFQNFRGKSVAILINTTAMDKEVVSYNQHVASNVWFMKAGVVDIASTKNLSYVIGTGATAGQVPDTIDGTTGLKGGVAIEMPAGCDHAYINYNALLNPHQDGAALQLKDGIYNAAAMPFAIDATGKVAFDYSSGGMTRTGNCEYLNATAKFDANLIKDETGTTIGIVFTQRAQ